MKRVLITGVNGFVGRHLARALGQEDIEVIGCDISADCSATHVPRYLRADLSDSEGLVASVADDLPEVCIHLASRTFVPASWTEPLETINTNITGTLNLLELYRNHGADSKLLIVSSVELYGSPPSDTRIDEDSPHHPESPYGLTKSFADNLSLLYARRYGMHVMTARPSNHIGPGQGPDFVVPSFARQCAKISHRIMKPRMRVGNLAAMRDFTDVRDVVRAYTALIRKGKGGHSYNIASGKLVTIRSVLDSLCRIAGIKPQIEVDPERYRKERPKATIDTARIHADTGWRPAIPLPQTLKDIYDQYDRELADVQPQ